MAHRGRRLIGTDALLIFVFLHVSRDGQEQEQRTENDPNVNAHQNKPAMAREVLVYKAYRRTAQSLATRRGFFIDHADIPSKSGASWNMTNLSNLALRPAKPALKLPCQSYPDCTITMRGYDFRERQGEKEAEQGDHRR
jgi:hypothetical protein